MTYIDKLLLALILRPAGLVLKNHIIIPTPLHCEILLIEQRVTECNITLTSNLLFLGALGLLQKKSHVSQLFPFASNTRKRQNQTYLSFLLFFSFLSNPLQLSLQLCILIITIVAIIPIIIVVLFTVIIGINVSRLF